MKKYTIILLFGIAATLTISSCEKDDTPDQPELPPIESMIMDFSDFSITQKSHTELLTNQNYFHAVADVTFWNLMLGMTIAVPTASYIQAFNSEPEYLGDNQWEWEYSVNQASAMYTARLVTTRQDNETFKAEMYISSDGLYSFSEFKWFEGIIRFDKTHAEWTLFESPQNNNELVSIVWNKDWELETSDITYTVVKPDVEGSGAYIKFEITNSSPFNAKYTISGNDNTVYIEWSQSTKEGRIKDPVVFEDEVWHCWNELGVDVDCTGK